MVFSVVLSGSPSADVSLRARAARLGGTARGGATAAGRDFFGFHSRAVRFASGASGDALTQRVTVGVIGDTLHEPDETFGFELYGLVSDDARVQFTGGVARLRVTGTITDDDDGPGEGDPVVSVQPVSMLEGSSGKKDMVFQVTLAGTNTEPITMEAVAKSQRSNAKWYPGTAKGSRGAGRDFVATEQTVTFVANSVELTKQVKVKVIGDDVDEPDETFTLRLKNLTGAVFKGGDTSIAVTGTIRNDDAEDAQGGTPSTSTTSTPPQSSTTTTTSTTSTPPQSSTTTTTTTAKPAVETKSVVTATMAGTTMTVSWTDAVIPDCEITRYYVTVYAFGGTFTQVRRNVTDATRTWEVPNIVLGHEYVAQVIAYGACGKSLKTTNQFPVADPTATTTTTEAQPDGPPSDPTSLTAQKSNGSVTFTWSSGGNGKDGECPTTGYAVQLKATQFGTALVTEYPTGTSWTPKITLQTGTQYYFHVSASGDCKNAYSRGWTGMHYTH